MPPNWRQIVNKLSFVFVCSQGIITKEIFLQFLRKLLKNTGCVKLFFRVQCSSLRGMPSDLPQKQGSIGPIILICQQRQSSITHPHACISMKEWPCLFLNQRQLYALLSINHSTCDSGSPWKYRHTTVKGPYLFLRRVLPLRKLAFHFVQKKITVKILLSLQIAAL